MPRTRCPHCQTIQSFEDEDRGSLIPCSACQEKFRLPRAPKGEAAPPKADTAGRGAVKRRPADEEEVTELEEVPDETADDENEEDPPLVTAADEDDDEDEDEQDRPRRGRAGYKDKEPRRVKKARSRRPAEGFSLVDTIGLDYTSQTNIFVGLGLVLYIALYFAVHMGNNCLALVLLPVCWGCYLWGCAAYAKSKNYSQWLGLLGILQLLGLIILVVLPYRLDD